MVRPSRASSTTVVGLLINFLPDIVSVSVSDVMFVTAVLADVVVYFEAATLLLPTYCPGRYTNYTYIYRKPVLAKLAFQVDININMIITWLY